MTAVRRQTGRTIPCLLRVPDAARELVFYGARVWPYESETISFEDACNSYRFVAELHGMLQAMLKSDKPGQAIKLRHYAKWMRLISSPAADMFFAWRRLSVGTRTKSSR